MVLPTMDRSIVLFLVLIIVLRNVQSGAICGANLNMVESTTDLTFMNQALAETNQERVNHGVPPLVLNEQLNKISQNWANQLANKYKNLVHTKEIKDYKGSICGENLYLSQSSAKVRVIDGAIPIKAWYAEISNYDFDKGVTKNGKAIGHFTQNVWKGSKQFGVALATSEGKNYVVATYFPAGNYVGEYRKNVLPAKGVVPPGQPSPPDQPTAPVEPNPPVQPSPPGQSTATFPPSPIGLCEFGLKYASGDVGYSVKRTISVCDVMKPKGGDYPEQTTPCPWRIFIYKNEIEQHHVQPVTLGSMYSEIFKGYLIAARKVTGQVVNGKEVLGDFIGHFEPQWDSFPVCCNGAPMPNMLESSGVRVRRPNQTLIWASPGDYVGPVVFVATFWRSMKTYWFDIRSPTINVIERRTTTTTTHKPSY